MKKITIFLNFAFLAFILNAILDELPSFEEWYEPLFFLLLLITPALNFYYLVFGDSVSTWLSMYTKRKILEEQKKINDLK